MAKVGIFGTILIYWLLRRAYCLARTPGNKPNIILVVLDDVGYGDFSSYGHPTQEINEVDKMAADGLRFTQWYATAALCTPSRAAILTGKLPIEMGMKLPYDVYMSCHPFALPKTETTVAQVLKDAGYRTGIVGKWHLGLNEQHYTDGVNLPQSYGFDDVRTILPTTLSWNCDIDKRHRQFPLRRSCFLYRNRTIVQQPIDLHHASATLANDAKAFIHDHADHPFFLYFAPLQAHTAMHNMPHFTNKSRRGIYGDQLNEMAWMVGEVQAALRREHLDNNTLILLVSDNGPHVDLCSEGGNAGPFHGEKWTPYEGGLRVPAIAWWPGVIDPGRVDRTIVNNLDILPTFAALAGVDSSRHSTGRGHSFADILRRPNHGHDSLHDIQYIYHDVFLMAVRYKQYKIHYHRYPEADHATMSKVCRGNFPTSNFMWHTDKTDQIYKLETPEIFNVDVDPGEAHPLPVEDYADLLKTVGEKIREYERTLPEKIPRTALMGNCRLSLVPCCNPPYCFCNYPGSLQYQTPVSK